MTKYYSHEPDFSSGSGRQSMHAYPGTVPYYGQSGADSAYQVTNLLSDIEEVTSIVRAEGLSHLYVPVGEAYLGKEMPSTHFTQAYERVETMLEAARRIHSDVLERIDGKFTKGVDKSLASLNEVNGSENLYHSRRLTYQKTHTVSDGYGNVYSYQRPEQYSLAEILNKKTSPIQATQALYQKRVKDLRAKLTEANGLSSEQIKKYRKMKDEELMSHFYVSGQLGDYQQLKRFQWQEDNKEWLEPVERWLGVGLLAVSVLAAAVSWGAGTPAVAAVATTIASTSGTAGTVYNVLDGSYSAITGNTLLSGTSLDPDERIWSAAEALASIGTMGVGRAFKAAGAADDTIRLATRVADVTDDATNLAHIGYNAMIRGEDPSLALVSFAGSKAVSGVTRHIHNQRVQTEMGQGQVPPDVTMGVRETNEIIQGKLSEYHLSEAEFNRLRATRVVDMTQAEYDMMIDIRNAVPNPTSQTVMQKIIPIEEADNYFGENAWGIRGYITKREDVTSITNIEEAVKGLRLDYDGSKFVDANGNIITDGYVRIEFQTKDTGYINIPFGEQNGIGLDPDPATGHGFIKSDEFLTSEYKVAGFKELKLEDGAKMYLNIDGDEIPVGEFKDGVFRYLED